MNRPVASPKTSRCCALNKECRAKVESTTGKKRKKKKKVERNDSIATIPSETKTQCQSSLLPSPTNLNHQTMSPKKEFAGKFNCTSEKKQCSSPSTTATPAGSSSSSLENSKPPSKITRLKQDHTTMHMTDHTEMLQHQLHNSTTITAYNHTNTETHTETGHQTIQSQPESCSSDNDKEKHRQPDAHEESLRWENQCSDEEKEKERIELYKRNRRKRYGKQFRSQQFSRSLSFSTPSESIS